tara:strand:- start:323 stop:664 length:342 start_codon:yes stop_codon:yes gene_type:complete
MASKFVFTALIFLLTSCTAPIPNIPIKVKNISEQQHLPKCLPASEMSRVLFEQFKETLKASAILSSSKKMLVLFYSSNKGSFTVTITGQDQISCAVIWGSDYSAEGRKGGVRI